MAENQERHLKQFNKIEWEKVMGKFIAAPDKDYNTSYLIDIENEDHQRFKIPKETIYKVDNENLYTTLTENEILASRRNDPFWTSMGSYIGHTGHEKE